uniref:WKF domain-containing protein n=1 Tax=Echinococcus granulosus TaxID=6210 RepID=A0A068WUR2_ECHGR|nr:protein of unknown function DUF2373 [Echinococcus granulosus]
MTIEAVLKSSKKHKKLLDFNKGPQAAEEDRQSSGRKRSAKLAEANDSRTTEVNAEIEVSKPTKKRKSSPAAATDSIEDGEEVSKRRHKSKRVSFGDVEKSKKKSVEAGKPETTKKSVKFAKKLVTLGSQSTESKSKPKVSILKAPPLSAKTSREGSEVEKVNDADENVAETKSRKPKKSKNALKRIKWVKRHRKKTLSRRKRRANRELARLRPQRNAEQHLSEAIEYLNAWYSSPETWKYKKVAQLTLIKHAFNPALIDEETFELLLHYLAGVQGAVVDRLRSMCQQIIDSGGEPPESPTFPLSIPSEWQASSVVVERATKMLEFLFIVNLSFVPSSFARCIYTPTSLFVQHLQNFRADGFVKTAELRNARLIECKICLHVQSAPTPPWCRFVSFRYIVSWSAVLCWVGLASSLLSHSRLYVFNE